LRLKWLTSVVGACAIGAVIAGCGSSSNSSSSTSASSAGSSGASSTAPITILSIGDTTAATKIIGTTHLAGLEAAAAYYNAQGGIDGHKVVIHHMSDNGDSTTAVSDLIQYLSSNPAPTMVDAGAEGGDAAALIPVLAKKNIFAIALNDGTHQCATGSQTTCPNEWTLADPSIDSQLPPANYLKAHGIKKVGILEEQIDFTESETPTFLQALKQDGISYSVATFPATALDLTPQLSQLKSSGAQAVYTEALVAPAGYALTARAKLAWNAPMLFDVAASSLDLTKLAPIADVKNNALVDIFYEMDPKNPQPGIQHLLQYGKQFGGVGAVPLDVASTGWDGIVALDQAVTTAGGKIDVKSLDAAMLKIPQTSPDRTFSRKLCFNATDHENVCGAPDDFEIVPAGPIVNGQVHSL
jgi:branched-chain amino acid transport system substrate-binding protein